jgi:dienelactone hydrolase
MKIFLFLPFFILVFLSSTPIGALAQEAAIENVGRDFRALLNRSPVNFNPSFQSFKSDSVLIEKGSVYTEETERVPVLIYKPVNTRTKSFPVVICLHGTGGSKEDENIKTLLYQLTRVGIMGVAIDARYHGERIAGGANKAQQYIEAIIGAWKNSDSTKQEHPFYYDTVYDLWKLTDYLITRDDVQPNRIGMMGISMGGIETWMAASVDKRIKVAVPVIAIQSFKWSLENDYWQGRAKTIWKAHEQAAQDLGDSAVTKENVRQLWNKLVPGITELFDCPSMIRVFAPRPLLLLNNEKDENCPLGGAKVAFTAAANAYKAKRASGMLKVHVVPNQPHTFLLQHQVMAINWFKGWL